MMSRRVFALAALSFLEACSSGSQGVSSADPLPTSPKPTPVVDLTTLSTTTSFQASAVKLDVRIVNYGNRLRGSAQSSTPETVTITYDPVQDTYALTGSTRSSSFAAGDRQPSPDDETFVAFSKGDPTLSDVLIILMPAKDSPAKEHYLATGLWQTSRPGADAGLVDFDTFIFGSASPTGAVPRTGSAQFPVLLLGLETSILDAPPYLVQGEGTFDIDFQRAVFRTSGEAFLQSLFDGSPGDPQFWASSGNLSSTSNSFTGRFSIGYENYADEQVVGTLLGQFYGPDATQLGATLTGESIFNIFGGALSGTTSGQPPAMPFTVLSSTGERNFEARYASFSYTRSGTSTVLSANPRHSRDLTNGGLIITDKALRDANAGLLTLNGAGDIALVPGTLDPGAEWQDFTHADARADLSDGEFAIYERVAGETRDRLAMFRVGPSNAAIALTYASFGSWSHVTQAGDRTDALYNWFVYGAPTLTDMIPRSGIGQYHGLMRGAGVARESGAEYALSGNAYFQVHFAGRGIDGTFEPVASPLNGAPALTLTPMSMSAAIDRDYSFKGSIWTSYAFGPLETGTWAGQLFGPGGEEAAGLIDFVAHDASGSLVADFSGVFVAKKAELSN